MNATTRRLLRVLATSWLLVGTWLYAKDPGIAIVFIALGIAGIAAASARPCHRRR